MDERYFEGIILEKEQEDLFCKIVEAVRNIPSEKRESFLVAQSSDGDFLQHPGFPDNEINFLYSDLRILAGYALVNQSGMNSYYVHPRGFQFYQYLKKRSGEPVEHIEREVRSFFDSHQFQKEYPKAYEKWAEAESLLWETETSKQLTKIGHLCREAIQDFMDTLYTEKDPPDKQIPKHLTILRLQAIINAESRQFGDTEKQFLEALISYWGSVNDLIQKQEHGAQKEKEQLVLKDARRVVFQTMIVMFEINQSLR